MFGVIEGFYGTPWTWDFRTELARALHGAGMDTYVYAPKDDPLHREQWRDPYPQSELDAFSRFVDAGALRLGVTISPGLTMEYESRRDRSVLRDKFLSLIDSGATTVGLLVDDIDPTPTAGADHGELAKWLREELPHDVDMFFVPLHYTGVEQAQYLTDIDQRIPHDVPIAWTGRYVVNRTITASDAQAWSKVMNGRLPLLWDNTPVNDAMMERHLFTGPLTGRDADLPQFLSGYLANPMVQGPPSIAPLLSAAAWWRGNDPLAAWQQSVSETPAMQRFMEAMSATIPVAYCDDALGGSAPLDGSAQNDVVSQDGLQRLKDWLVEVIAAGDGGFGAEVAPWTEALHQEANIALLAVELLLADDEKFAQDFIVVLTTAMMSRHEKYALGATAHVQPRMTHDALSNWRLSGAAVEASTNIADRLMAAVYRRATRNIK